MSVLSLLYALTWILAFQVILAAKNEIVNKVGKGTFDRQYIFHDVLHNWVNELYSRKKAPFFLNSEQKYLGNMSYNRLSHFITNITYNLEGSRDEYKLLVTLLKSTTD